MRTSPLLKRLRESDPVLFERLRKLGPKLTIGDWEIPLVISERLPDGTFALVGYDREGTPVARIITGIQR